MAIWHSLSISLNLSARKSGFFSSEGVLDESGKIWGQNNTLDGSGPASDMPALFLLLKQGGNEVA